MEKGKAKLLGRSKKGFTLLEMVVAVVVMLIVGSVAGAFLLRHIHKSQVSTLVSDIETIRTALVSTSLRGELVDSNGDGNYLDDLVKVGAIDKEINGIKGATFELKKETSTSDSLTIYYLFISCENEECKEIVEDLDKEIDEGNGRETGIVQWTES